MFGTQCPKSVFNLFFAQYFHYTGCSSFSNSRTRSRVSPEYISEAVVKDSLTTDVLSSSPSLKQLLMCNLMFCFETSKIYTICACVNQTVSSAILTFNFTLPSCASNNTNSSTSPPLSYQFASSLYLYTNIFLQNCQELILPIFIAYIFVLITNNFSFILWNKGKKQLFCITMNTLSL